MAVFIILLLWVNQHDGIQVWHTVIVIWVYRRNVQAAIRCRRFVAYGFVRR